MRNETLNVVLLVSVAIAPSCKRHDESSSSSARSAQMVAEKRESMSAAPEKKSPTMEKGPLNPRVQRSTPAPKEEDDDAKMRMGHMTIALATAAGQRSTVQLQIDSDQKLFVTLARGGRGARYSFTDASGAMPPLMNFATGEIEADSAMEEFEIRDVKAGPMTLALEAGPDPAQLQGMVFFTNGRALAVTLDPWTDVHSNSVVQLRARILDQERKPLVGQSPTFTAELRSGGRPLEKIDLLDDGAHADLDPKDGVFGALLGGSEDPLPEGQLDILVHGIEDVDGSRVERTGEGFLHVQVTGAGFVGEMTETVVDSNGNGLYDELRFEQEVRVDEPGHYQVSAMWGPTKGEPINQLHGRVDAKQKGAGTYHAILTVPGEDISRWGVDGTYTLTNVMLTREDVFGEVAKAPDHLSRSYSVAQFERPAGPDHVTCFPSGAWVTDNLEVNVMGTGLRDATEVLVDGRSVPLQLRDDAALGILVPPPDRPLTEAERAAGGRSVDVEVRTKWGKFVATGGFQYKP